MNLDKYLNEQHALGLKSYLRLANQIQCADGFTLSAQASRYHYCSPREDVGPWDYVEVGFPSSCEEKLMPYIECPKEDPTKSVYGNVPVALVEGIIESHGGMK